MRTGDLALWHEGELYVTGRSKEIIFVNGQNYYPHDLEMILQAEPGLEHGKVAAAGVRSPGAPTDELVLFVVHARRHGGLRELAAKAMHLVNEHAGVEVARVVPVTRMPKTTSGKLQRNALAEAYANGEFAAELAAFDAAWAAAHGQGRAAAGGIERQIKAIVDDALPGKHVDVDDNLFEVGASSLTLIQIHEKIDELYPGAVDLTELFDFPTVSQLAKHLEKLEAAADASHEPLCVPRRTCRALQLPAPVRPPPARGIVADPRLERARIAVGDLAARQLLARLVQWLAHEPVTAARQPVHAHQDHLRAQRPPQQFRAHVERRVLARGTCTSASRGWSAAPGPR